MNSKINTLIFGFCLIFAVTMTVSSKENIQSTLSLIAFVMIFFFYLNQYQDNIREINKTMVEEWNKKIKPSKPPLPPVAFKQPILQFNDHTTQKATELHKQPDMKNLNYQFNRQDYLAKSISNTQKLHHNTKFWKGIFDYEIHQYPVWWEDPFPHTDNSGETRIEAPTEATLYPVFRK